MGAKKRGLGRGLDALLGSGLDESPAAKTGGGEAGGSDGLRELAVDLLQRGRYQPRSGMDPAALEELAASIRAQGVIQPVVVRALSGGDRYEIIAGERRWRAAQLAGLQNVPVVVREVSDQGAMAMALIENIQREDLNPLEEAVALERLIREFDMTHQQCADAVGRSRAAVSNLLRLLELNPTVKAHVEAGELEMGHARALLALPMEQQPEAAARVVARGMSVRETEALVKRLLANPDGTSKAKPELDPNIRSLQDKLSEQLGAAVNIQHANNGKGKLSIQYNSLDELDGILAHIR